MAGQKLINLTVEEFDRHTFESITNPTNVELSSMRLLAADRQQIAARQSLSLTIPQILIKKIGNTP